MNELGDTDNSLGNGTVNHTAQCKLKQKKQSFGLKTLINLILNKTKIVGKVVVWLVCNSSP